MVKFIEHISYPGFGYIDPYMDEDAPLIHQDVGEMLVERLNELAGDYHRIREIEHDIIERKLFSPDLPLMPYICEKHNIDIEQYIIISHNVHDHACSRAIYEKLTENQDD